MAALPKDMHGFFIFNWKRVEAESRILKQSSEQREQLKCAKMWESLSEARCSRMRVASVYWFHQ